MRSYHEIKKAYNMGFGGFSGHTMSSIKHHYAIIPIYLMSIAAAGMAGLYVLRLATRHPEVTWTRNTEPWHEYSNKQYKFLASGREEYGGFQNPAPRY